MAELKTKPNDASVEKFLAGISDETKRKDSLVLLDLMKKVTKSPPKMWGGSIVGFGTYRYKYASGREGEWFAAGFSPRKQNLSLYIMSGFRGHEELLEKLGKHKKGKGCLYVNKLDDIDLSVLRKLVESSVRRIAKGQIDYS
jgi:hypothetical protein